MIWISSAFLVAVAGDSVDFDRDVLPILSEHCFHCHGPDAAKRKADLRLDVRDDVLFIAEPGKPGESELVARIDHADPESRMPPASFERPLSAEQADVLRRWIEEGIAWESHWAFEDPRMAAAPEAGERALAWARDPLDVFVFERLTAEGLEPSPPAAPGVWLRRVTLGLTGLPPSVDDLEAFERAIAAVDTAAADTAAADSVAAIRAIEEAAVDRLLGARSRAEHRTREWLDLARYADTNGYQNDFRRDQWPWRDWVLRAFERNLPYDRFVLEQVAGDLVPDASLESILATGFQRNHRTVTEGGSIDEEWRVENVADRAETTATAFLGLTLACARCHDHKYDALTQRDYYGFYAFFDSIDEKGVYLETRGNVAPILRVPTAEQNARLAELDAEAAGLLAELDDASRDAAERHAAWRLASDARRAPELPSPVLVHGASTSDPVELTGQATDHVEVGREVSFEQDRPFTVSLWLRPDSHGAVYSRMNDDDRYRGTDLVLLGDLRPAVHLIHSWTDNAIKVVGIEPLQVGTWQHVAVCYDGSRKAAGVTLFVNGKPVAVEALVDALDGTIASDEPFRLGLRRYAGALRGALLDVRVDGAALSEEQVLALPRARALREDGIDFFRACFDQESVDLRERLARSRAEHGRIEQKEVATAMVLRDRDEPRETRMLARGQYDRPVGEPLTPDVPAVFGGLPEGEPRDRLGLARWLVDPAQPLTARVAVNRVWTSFFGLGLVTTPEDFGVRGDRPVHRELLDRLACDFVESGWDLRALERRIALSGTYRQSSVASPALRERDPDNRLLARGPRHRLAAEMLRDQALAVSGLLVERWGGPPVKPYQPEGLWKELAGGAGQGAYVPSEGADLFRRSVYTYRKRTVPHPTLTTFDAPGFELCTVRRSRTNTPLQALALLNDVTYVEAARHFARRMMDAGEAPDARLVHGVRALLAREATAAELDVLRAALARHTADFERDIAAADALLAVGSTGVRPDQGDSGRDAAARAEWAAYTLIASTLLNLDEALTLR